MCHSPSTCLLYGVLAALLLSGCGSSVEKELASETPARGTGGSGSANHGGGSAPINKSTGGSASPKQSGGSAGVDTRAGGSTGAGVSAGAGGSAGSNSPLGSGGAGVEPVSCAPFDASAGRLLSRMGLYSDIRGQTLARGVSQYEPAYALWADGTGKKRFLLLPADTRIDTSDMDHWQFPVGTKFFKEFSLNGQRLETRLIERTDNSGQSADYSLSAFIWRADGCDAVETPEGAANVLGTTHDVPSSRDCVSCHASERGRILGFSAIQLSKTGDPPTLKSLSQAGLLSNPPPSGVDYPVPGDVVTATALGYLHANCGHCHSPDGVYSAANRFPVNQLNMNLRLSVSDRTPETTTIWKTTVNVRTEWFFGPGITVRIASGKPSASAIPYRMDSRGNDADMPPIATKTVDSTGLAAVRAWIASLP